MSFARYFIAVRPLAILLLTACALFGWTQTPPTGEQPAPPANGGGSARDSLPSIEELMGAMTAPQVSMAVQKHSDHADYVTITVVTPDYPESLLRDQIAEMGRLLNSEARGLRIGQVEIDAQKKIRFLRAMFAIDDVIDPVSRTFQLNALVRPFVSDSLDHPVNSFHIVFQNESPIPNRTIDRYSDEHVSVAGQYFDNPKSIEYRIQTKTVNPAEINIPVDAPAARKKAAPAMGPARPTPMIIGIILLAGVALGALVYFAMLRSPKA